MGWRRPRSLSQRWGALRAGRARQARLESPALSVHIPAAQGSASGGALPMGSQTRLAHPRRPLGPRGLRACAPSLAGRSSRPSHLTVLGMQVHLELLGHDHRDLQTETVPGSSLEAFLLPSPTSQGDLRQDQRALTFLIGRVVHAHRGDPRTCRG